ncbi:uncharacterized protein [Blastocystis hominis]|uniref:Uncharacterized protein n=1 Tax=Blastocystis hominis TaxID=12968 RepID=D8M7D3_BLAHO|nr:uncharacterized protein [Blastocystis hominis]CBK23972.2 unnamed protein product [Blastocystis hominis]|eukprot:XP_012898020.1 uncharacterized protein [Blastocystis hominis]
MQLYLKPILCLCNVVAPRIGPPSSRNKNDSQQTL